MPVAIESGVTDLPKVIIALDSTDLPSFSVTRTKKERSNLSVRSPQAILGQTKHSFGVSTSYLFPTLQDHSSADYIAYLSFPGTCAL
uniref:Uncharacterized protein n=1 Tax=Utricularia reniformis TaxID=192314 RepID=A0A1Y0B479_9LAMI|nr:hypothetical protein AEK19_MT1976 [Utricularia reniformis]ART32139.1 hypothetical protein AEK19_MT1976 [Utricularia reniformis]